MKPSFPLSLNILAGFAGRAWALLLNLALVPVYIQYLGVAAYGLIGIHASLTVILSVLDFGLSTTLNREMARLSVNGDRASETRDTLRTYEILYWAVGLLLGTAIVISSQWLSTHWLTDKEISTFIVQKAIAWMGVVVAFQWPVSLYSGALQGLQKQVTLNLILMLSATLKGGGAIIVLTFVNPSILAFFTWQAISTGISTFLILYITWKSLPTGNPTHTSVFRADVLRNNWRFSLGMTGIGILSTLLTQIDKIILSNKLSLEDFGFYSLASSVGISLIFLVGPIANAIFPRFTQLATEGRQAELTQLYHRICQLVSMAVVPLSITVIFFSREVLHYWLNDSYLVEHTSVLLSLIAAGTTLNALVTIPLNMQLAHGWTNPTLLINLFSVVTIVPLMLVLVSLWGAIGAAIAWVCINLSYFLFYVPFMHSKLLRGELVNWYKKDVGMTLISSIFIAMVTRTLLVPKATLASPMLVGITFLGCIFISILTSPYLSSLAKSYISRTWATFS